eukprot:COSAG02_NODE_4438_length_5356_cov_3.223321_1_plen_61_part_00
MRSERPIVHEILVTEIERSDKELLFGFSVLHLDAVIHRQLPIHFLWVGVCFAVLHIAAAT